MSVELEIARNGVVSVVVLGLDPAFNGNGLGGALHTRATELAWSLASPIVDRTSRVWLQTSSDDHPHALSNDRAAASTPAE